MIKRFLVYLKKIKAKSNDRVSYILFWAFVQYIVTGMSFGDFLIFELSNKSFRERCRYISKRNRKRYEKIFNYKNEDVFLDKYVFDKTFRKYIKRDFLYLNDCTESEFKDFVSKHNTFFSKVNYLCEGQGITKVTVNNNAEELYNELKQKEILIEEPIIQHHELSKLNTTSINSVRISTVRKANHVEVIAASLKIGNAGKCTDNLHGGGLCYSVDINSGIVQSVGYDGEGNKYLVHPSNGAIILGFKIPYWNEAVSLVEECATIVDGVNWIGWDVAITEDGPVIVEGNTDQAVDLIQFGNKGLNPVIKGIIKNKYEGIICN